MHAAAEAVPACIGAAWRRMRGEQIPPGGLGVPSEPAEQHHVSVFFPVLLAAFLDVLDSCPNREHVRAQCWSGTRGTGG